MTFHSFTTYAAGANAAAAFVEFLNNHGVTCSLSSSTLTISDFNGLSFGAKLNAMSSGTHFYAGGVVTDAGKELIVLECWNGESAPNANISKLLLFMVYRDSTGLRQPGNAQGTYGFSNAKTFGGLPAFSDRCWIGSDQDLYLIPMPMLTGVTGGYYQPIIRDDIPYYYCVNSVYVAPGAIISDGKKQFLSCGCFIFMEYV